MDQSELFPVATAALARRPQEPIVRTALVEPPYRFWLKRAWGAGPMVAWAMLNPSVADSAKDDPTMLRVMEFSLRWGFGSCVVVNIYPFITPDPKEMRKWCAGFLRDGNLQPIDPVPERDAWDENIAHCARELTAATRRVAAWGNNADGQDVSWWLESIHLERALESQGFAVPPEISGETRVMDIGDPIRDWLCLGTTTSGAPKHPLARGQHRVPPDFKPVPWTMPA